MWRPGTGSAAPSTEHKTEGQYVRRGTRRWNLVGAQPTLPTVMCSATIVCGQGRVYVGNRSGLLFVRPSARTAR